MNDQLTPEDVKRMTEGTTILRRMSEYVPDCNYIVSKETERRLFAGMAMLGLLNDLGDDRHRYLPRELAESSVVLADALIAELERTKK